MSLRTKSNTTVGTPATESTSSSDADQQETEVQNNSTSPPSRSLSQRAISQTLASSAQLANLLPTGTILAFQLLTPIFTNNGTCDSATHAMTLVLHILLTTSCFLASFTDSFKSTQGKVYYGLATRKGMWLFDYPTTASSLPDLSKYRLRFIDFVHAFLSVLVFISIALKDKNVLSCYYPEPAHETKEVLDILPIGIGLICGMLFLVFPTTRHGIGYPVTAGN